MKFDGERVGGVRKTRYVTFHGSRQRRREGDDQDPQPAGCRHFGRADKATVGQYLTAWLQGSVGSPKTVERYHELLKNQIDPHIGAIKLQRLRPEHIQRWHGTLLATGLSKRTIRHAHKLLHRALADALLNGTVNRNVASIHRPPTPEDTEIEILTVDQAAEVRTKLADRPLYPIVALALGTGLRRGELLALQWGDVDLEAGALTMKGRSKRPPPV